MTYIRGVSILVGVIFFMEAGIANLSHTQSLVFA